MSIDLTMGRKRGKWSGGMGLACGLFLMILPLLVQAQRPPDNVRIHEWDGRGYQPCEPSIAINPRNPEEMIAGSILDNVYRSTNGGWTWDRDRKSVV